jgi:hypothetical protein
MKDAALKLALDALENSVDLVFEAHTEAVRRYGDYPSRKGKIDGLKVLADAHQGAIDAIKAALAQPAQQPIGDKRIDPKDICQREFVGLTEDEMQETCVDAFSYDPYVIARAIEAKLKERNT